MIRGDDSGIAQKFSQFPSSVVAEFSKYFWEWLRLVPRNNRLFFFAHVFFQRVGWSIDNNKESIIKLYQICTFEISLGISGLLRENSKNIAKSSQRTNKVGPLPVITPFIAILRVPTLNVRWGR